MDASSIPKAGKIIRLMHDSVKKMERAMDKNDSDSIMESKKEILDLQKQLNALI